MRGGGGGKDAVGAPGRGTSDIPGDELITPQSDDTTGRSLSEDERLRALRRHALLDTPPEASFDRIVALASRALQAPIASVTLVDADRQWSKAVVGPLVQQAPRGQSICSHTIAARRTLVIEDLSADERFTEHPMVAGAPHLRFYAGVPLESSGGAMLGTLCVMDVRPRVLSQEERDTLEDLANLAMDALRMRLAQLANRQLLTLIETVSVGVLVTDPNEPDNPITFANRGFETVSGYSPAESIGRNCRFLQGPGTSRETVDRMRASIREQRVFRGVLRNYRKDGTEFWNDLTITPVFDEQGKLASFISVQNDITDRERAEQAVRESLARLRELERQRDTLTGMIVHDMRSPLTVATSFLEMLRSDAGDCWTADDHEALAYSAGAVSELNAMVTSLLDVSRLEAGEMPLQRAPLDVVALIRKTLASREAIEGADRLRLTLPNAPVMAVGDAGITARIINNLVGNALKFTPENGLVQVTVATESSGVQVSVRDTGPGIAPEHHERIFEKFGQVESARVTHSTGLGLAFCRLAAEAQGGRIGVESAMGAGSTFWFTVPSVGPDQGTLAPIGPSAAEARRPG